MKRSEINALLRKNKAFLERMSFKLPRFADWSPEEWRHKGPECSEIVENLLGWDITDFGSGDFERVGLFLFTVRNGSLAAAEQGGKSYAEKIMIVEEGQVTPTHFHYNKMEDIINRGGGDLVVQLWNSGPNEELLDTEVTVQIDSVRTRVPAAGTITLTPGESVCLPQHLYHQFWGRKGGGVVLVGEVSRVNDDRVDNRFYQPVGRFPAIEEDEEPLHLLCMDYPRYYGCI